MLKISLTILSIIIILPFSIVNPQDDGFTVSGKVHFPKTGDIYLQLTNKEHYDGYGDTPFYKIIKLSDEDVDKKEVSFRFDSVPEDYYGITCFQDVNGDGKLNSGLFGPTEPWGTYKPHRPLFRRPNFDEVKFYVDKNITDIEFKLK
jgi:uncharacterized protein (DUF2141 family)